MSQSIHLYLVFSELTVMRCSYLSLNDHCDSYSAKQLHFLDVMTWIEQVNGYEPGHLPYHATIVSLFWQEICGHQLRTLYDICNKCAIHYSKGAQFSVELSTITAITVADLLMVIWISFTILKLHYSSSLIHRMVRRSPCIFGKEIRFRRHCTF
jgi:hypothetical protein